MADDHEVTGLAARAPSELNPLVAQVLRENPNPDALERLIELQERWEDRQAKQSFTEALVELKAALPPFLGRDTLVDYQAAKGRVHYRHTSLAHAYEMTFPLLSRHGFAFDAQPGRTDRGDVQVVGTLRHRGGHAETATLTAPPDTSGAKSPAQSVASTVTLLTRYLYVSLLGLATADMTEDGDQTEKDEHTGVDAAARLRLAREIVDAGRTRESAEELVGRPVRDWTGEDLVQIRAWLRPAAKVEADHGVVPSGKLAGTRIADLDDRQLAWYCGWAEKYQHGDFLDALTAETERRHARDRS